MTVWLPTFRYDGENLDDFGSEKKDYVPWIVSQSGETRLDEDDPLGATCANFRARIAREYALALSLVTNDPFGRVWQGKDGTIALRAEAWGREDKYAERGPHSGQRLCCSALSLKDILEKFEKELLLLICLERRETSYRESSRYSHTVAVVRITKSLDIEYFQGYINRLHTSRY